MNKYENLGSYDPSQIEEKWYDYWETHGVFHDEPKEGAEPFSIVLPPPNVTGQLHMGHALDGTLQDILIRYKRMQGYNVLWLPGKDHAGIATQVKVEKQIAEEGLTKYDLGREKFLERVWQWKEKYGNTIGRQIRKLGSSCDWTRERFTMDPVCARAVREVFCSLYEKGLIYQGNRITNWCPRCQTALSDIEVEHEDEVGHLYYINYPVVGEDSYVQIATTRPETIPGDTAVAVNPEDERFSSLIGKKLLLPTVGREIPVIADEYVDPKYGTGCVKITPAHDPNDFAVGERHNLESIVIMNLDGTLNEKAGKYNGMTREEARKQIIADLKDMGLLVKIEETKHAVGHCSRCHTTVEPMTTKQWFVKMKPLAGPAMQAVKEGRTKFVPDRFANTYIQWLENIHDWCISRQLWWGHRIPVWYCDDCGKTIVSRTDVEACPHCGSHHIHQDPDVLDTWFSSALWPFSTMGWPDQTELLKKWYPTSVLVTGYDIIFFWVARMMFMAMEFMHEIPFKYVFIHGLVRDSQGRKMSKSLGNGIDPLEMAEKYGADALRFNLITGNSPGNDMRFFVDKCEAMRNFANKIWNASRFVMMNLSIDKVELPEKLELEDKWILSKLNTLIREVTDNLEAYELGVASAKIYDFIWDTYCDWYIELTKTRLNGEDAQAKQAAENVLCYVLLRILELLHPFMPFITEEIWQALPHEGRYLISAEWPEYQDALHFPEAEAAMEAVKDAISAIRARRAEMNVPPSRKAQVILVTAQPENYQLGTHFITRMAYASELTVLTAAPADLTGMVTVATHDATVYMPMAELVDIAKELERIATERKKAEENLQRIEAKLANESFTSRAPENVVNAEREKAEKARALIAKLDASAAAMKL